MNPTATTTSGQVRGASVAGIGVFKGIPFAAPPFGANRLRPPQAVPAWTGVRDALEFGPKSPQLPYPPPIDELIPESAGPGEDCLTLNVWTPGLGPVKRPVMVWIAGGMFEYHGTGACPWYDGSRFARDGIVCVTINYRVGAEGFLYLADGIANLGLLDQVAALEWVRDNIAAFGGDRDNVTIFGESAGAMSVGILLAVPRARGLFRRAIAQSGAGVHVSGPDAGLAVARRLAETLGIAPTRAAFAEVSPDRMLEAQARLRLDLMTNPDPARWGAEVVASNLPWQPVVDGDVLPGLPLELVAAGAAANVDLLLGSNDHENRLFLVPGGLIDQIPIEAVIGTIRSYGLAVHPMLAAYQEWNPGANPGELLSAIQTDGYWRLPAIRLAEAHASRARGASTYMYEFGWRSPQMGGRLGACHSLEIPFVFDTLGEHTEFIHGPTPPGELASAMHRAWVGFATNGQCPWPRYDPVRRATMRFAERSEVRDDPRAAERTLWGLEATAWRSATVTAASQSEVGPRPEPAIR